MAKETTTIYLSDITYPTVFGIYQYLKGNNIECTISSRIVQNDGKEYIEVYRYNFADPKDAMIFALMYC